MTSRRSGASSSKTPLGSMCPICDHPLHKQHSRDHVAWHFMEELKAYIIDPSKCPECSYTGDKLESVARHLALYHQKLDQFLSDTDLVAEKRAKAMAKPKKVNGSRIFSLFAPDATGLAAEMVGKKYSENTVTVTWTSWTESLRSTSYPSIFQNNGQFLVFEKFAFVPCINYLMFPPGLRWIAVHHMRVEGSFARARF